MPALEDFVGNTKQFLRRGPLVIADAINARKPASAANYSLQFDIGETQYPHGHKAFTVTEVVQGGRQAFYLPWDNNQSPHIDLNNTRSFFFTAELSGCIMVFQRGAGANARVMHIGANVAANKNALIAASFGANPVHICDSESDEVGSVCGIRTATGWVFYVQQRGLGFQLITVRPGQGPRGVHKGALQLDVPGQMRDIYTYDCR